MIEIDDLLKEISDDGLTQLSDLDGDGERNDDVISDAISDAISFIESFIVIPVNPTPLLKKICVDLAIFELRRKNELINENDRMRQKELESYLSKMSKGSMPTTTTDQESGKKRDTSFAFRISKRKIQKRD
ncbi:MAG: DUF1320 family protein [Sulfurovaceae bacterium]|nr:DUF1320 family protein [Sulfurovaceae bacterium]